MSKIYKNQNNTPVNKVFLIVIFIMNFMSNNCLADFVELKLNFGEVIDIVNFRKHNCENNQCQYDMLINKNFVASFINHENANFSYTVQNDYAAINFGYSDDISIYNSYIQIIKRGRHLPCQYQAPPELQRRRGFSVTESITYFHSPALGCVETFSIQQRR